MKKTSFTSHKQHLLGLLFSRNAKETHADQIILQCFYSLSKERTHKPSKEVAAKNFISSVNVIGTNSFGECFLPHLITRTYCFSQKCVVALRFFLAPCCSVL